ncbi:MULTISPECIES: hypothetical protein [unclassified Olleya]|uniref:hypothetical protein n=1 Tax=unclassified Olleya TaxID=2615019 RepID=UPI000C310917|nr:MULTISPECIES: hypothetical protein [unclassified Olleya]AUC76396.1 hypothetical protein CW732_12260 [Olleya sp. Bg11-27]QXP58665.1 hypothetical protein H0I26_12155 [Olleya sp. HaHaR_3_96]
MSLLFIFLLCYYGFSDPAIIHVLFEASFIRTIQRDGFILVIFRVEITKLKITYLYGMDY